MAFVSTKERICLSKVEYADGFNSITLRETFQPFQKVELGPSLRLNLSSGLTLNISPIEVEWNLLAEPLVG